MDIRKTFTRLQNGNDVRGAAIATEKEELTLTPAIASFITAGFADYLSRKTGKAKADLRIGIGHDSRLTAEAMQKGCIAGLAGTQVFCCHLISTPAMFQSTVYEESSFDGSLMITASHLPFNRNGIKFFTREGGIGHDELTEIMQTAISLAEDFGPGCLDRDVETADTACTDFDLAAVYSAHMGAYIKEQVQAEDYDMPLAGLHIVVDAGNGAAGFFATDILEALGADISGSVFLDPDGTFPNHVPNPENRDAMNAVRKAVLDAGADLGVIFDCDGDRGAVVFADGREINRNTLIALLAAIVRKTSPGSTVVTDSCTSDELRVFLEEQLGMKHLRFMRGYKNVINKGIELNAAGEACELAIETSGHGAFRENYFSDDGAYIGVKIIIELARMRRQGRNLEALLEGFTEPEDATELRLTISDPEFRAYGARVVEDFRAFAEADGRFHIVEPNYEGIRISFDDEEVQGWMLMRQSLHDPVLAMNIEAKKAGGCAVIEGRIRRFLDRYDKLS